MTERKKINDCFAQVIYRKREPYRKTDNNCLRDKVVHRLAKRLAAEESNLFLRAE